MNLDEHAILVSAEAVALNCIAARLAIAGPVLTGYDQGTLLGETATIRRHMEHAGARHSGHLRFIDALEDAIRNRADVSDVKELLRSLIGTLGLDSSGIV